MRSFLRISGIVVSTLLMIAGLSVIAFADSTFSAAWYQDAAGNWHARNAGGANVANAWFCDDAIASNGQNVWYLLDGTGNMITAGLLLQSKMRRGWKN